MNVEVIGIDPNAGDATEIHYVVDVAGTIYDVERYADRHYSGETWRLDGEEVESPLPDDVWWSPEEDAKAAAYWQRYQDEVRPLIDKIHKEVFG